MPKKERKMSSQMGGEHRTIYQNFNLKRGWKYREKLDSEGGGS